MAKEISGENAAKQMEALGKCIGEAKKKIQTIGATTAAGLIKARIHNDGKDAHGNDLKGYSQPYAKKRRKAGRQTAKKDLQFSGRLFRSEQVYTLRGNVVFGIIPGKRNDKGRKSRANRTIAKFIEESEDVEIFVSSEEELKQINAVVEKAIDDEIIRCFNQF